jgi:nicotinamidase-related amidase
MAAQGLVYGPIGDNCLHLCVDMQRLFGAGSPWAVPWLERVLPAIESLCGAHPRRTVFTRFIPANRPGEARGTWARYYRRWADVTLDNIGVDAVRLVPALERFVPPAQVVDKRVYSPWGEGNLDRLLVGSQVNTVVVTGGETDVCVLGTVLGAVDRGLRVILATDALCSSSDQTHDALMELYLSRFSQQIEAAGTEEILAQWR